MVDGSPTIVWFRQDLRLGDNPALAAAVKRGGPIVPAYIWSPEEEGAWGPGGATKYWLHQSLRALARDLEKRGSRLIIRAGGSANELARLIAETGAGSVYWNRRYEPEAIQRDTRIKAELQGRGIEAKSFNGGLLFEPTEIQTKAGGPFQVFTPFWKACLAAAEPPAPLAAPRQIAGPKTWPNALEPAALRLEPGIDWAGGIREAWQPGEAGAWRLLERFLEGGVIDYPEERDRPDRAGTSRLSPHLHFGEIGPRQIWHAARDREGVDGRTNYARGSGAWLRQLIWREFAHHLLFHFPRTPLRPLREDYERFPWKRNARMLRAWQRGRTGYPTVDAAMRELWHTGWMHNRMRMLTASFLVKHLLIPWQDGAKWFWDTLVDADLANNTLGWQWTAGCGADAAPYFRIFNPISQGTKFDPEGAYVRRWVPELAGLSNDFIHQPWEATPLELAAAGVRLGETYPERIVEHHTARERALDALATLKK